jgi:multiple antibiotic resistance protein
VTSVACQWMSRAFHTHGSGRSPLRAAHSACVAQAVRSNGRGERTDRVCRAGLPTGFLLRALAKNQQMRASRVTWQKFIGTTMLLYGLINPIGVIPIYLNLVQESADVKSKRVIAVAAVAVACLLICAAIFGQEILNFFNVGLDDFRIAGGLLALFISFEMFQAHYGGFMQTFEERMEADLHSIAITPLAFPLLVGPAEMSIMITLSNDTAHPMDKVLLISASALTTGLMALTLWVAGPSRRALGTTGINVVTRVMALIVASVGINFIMTGLKNELPGLLR